MPARLNYRTTQFEGYDHPDPACIDDADRTPGPPLTVLHPLDIESYRILRNYVGKFNGNRLRKEKRNIVFDLEVGYIKFINGGKGFIISGGARLSKDEKEHDSRARYIEKFIPSGIFGGEKQDGRN